MDQLLVKKAEGMMVSAGKRRKDKSQENRIHIANETQRNDLGNRSIVSVSTLQELVSTVDGVSILLVSFHFLFMSHLFSTNEPWV